MQDLTTVEAFVAYADAANDPDTASIQRMITAYSTAVRSYTNRDFTLESYSRTFDGANNTRLMLSQYPIVSVTGLQVGMQVIPAAPAFGATGFRFDERTVMLNGYRFARGEGNVLVSWTAGFATVPSDIEEAVIEWMATRYANRGDRAGWSSKTLAGETVSLMIKGMPETVKIVLDNASNKVPTG